MKETTGTQTRKGGLISRVSAKPGDPVFKEGWLITMGLSGKPSSMPQNGTPDKADDKAGESGYRKTT